MDELSDSGGGAGGSLPISEAHCLIVVSLLFLWVNRGFWSLRLSIQLFQQALNKTNKQKGKEGRAEIKWIIVQANVKVN